MQAGGLDPKRHIPSAHALYCMAVEVAGRGRRGGVWVGFDMRVEVVGDQRAEIGGLDLKEPIRCACARYRLAVEVAGRGSYGGYMGWC